MVQHNTMKDNIAAAQNTVFMNIHFFAFCSDEPSNDTVPASLVLSSQIPGYDGRELDINETVELTFPIKVCINDHSRRECVF